MFQGEVVGDYLKEVKTVNGKLSAEFAASRRLLYMVLAKAGDREYKIWLATHYEPRYVTFIFDSKMNTRYTVITYLYPIVAISFSTARFAPYSLR